MDQYLNRQTTRVLKRLPNFSGWEYSSFYILADGYHLFDLFIEHDSWLNGKQDSDRDIINAGFIYLGIENPVRAFNGTPSPDTIIQKNDLLVVYGNESHMAALLTLPSEQSQKQPDTAIRLVLPLLILQSQQLHMYLPRHSSRSGTYPGSCRQTESVRSPQGEVPLLLARWSS